MTEQRPLHWAFAVSYPYCPVVSIIHSSSSVHDINGRGTSHPGTLLLPLPIVSGPLLTFILNYYLLTES